MVKENRSVLSGMSRTWCAGALLMMAGVVTSACGNAIFRRWRGRR